MASPPEGYLFQNYTWGATFHSLCVVLHVILHLSLFYIYKRLKEMKEEEKMKEEEEEVVEVEEVEEVEESQRILIAGGGPAQSLYKSFIRDSRKEGM